MNHLPWFSVIGKLFVPLVLAASTQTLSLSAVPTTLDENAESEITVQFSCPSCSTDSYLRGAFYPSGSSYFGYTQSNDGTWTNAPGGSCTQYYKILQTDLSKEGTWSGVLKVKPDTASPYYNGPGEYLFKVGRYTPSCSSASVWSGEVTIAITGPTHTPTPVPTTTTAPTNTPNPTATHTPSPSVTPTATPSSTGAPSPTEQINPDILGSAIASESVETSDAIPETSDEATISGARVSQSPFVFSFLCIGSGLALLSFATAWQKTDVWKKIIKRE